MYEPPAAREDTGLFPSFQKIVSKDKYKEMGEKFEDEEHTHCLEKVDLRHCFSSCRHRKGIKYL